MKKISPLSLSKLLAVACLMPVVLSACTFNSQMISGNYSGNSARDAYMAGFHDGRHSGLSKAGAASENVIKDISRFAEDAEYRDGWIAGELEGIRIQKESSASAGVVSKSKPQKESDKALPGNKTVDPDLIPDRQPSKLKF